MGDGKDDDQVASREVDNRGGARAVADLHLAKAISHLTLALEALDRADVGLACGYVDLALTICMDARVERHRPRR